MRLICFLKGVFYSIIHFVIIDGCNFEEKSRVIIKNSRIKIETYYKCSVCRREIL
jgi:hypothetical protein